MAADVTNIKIEPMSVYLGSDVSQVSTITTVADAAGSLNNDYFFIYLPSDAGYYVWFNVDAGGTDPSIAGFTAIPVAISSGDTANQVASDLQSAINGVSGFTAAVSTNVVTVTCDNEGYAQGPHEGVGTGFSFSVTTQGDEEEEIGYTDGAIEMSFSEDMVDVLSHQTGTNVLTQIRTGKQVEMTVTFKELSKTQLRNIFVKSGAGAFTPSGSSGTEVFGYGTHRDFTSTESQAGKVRLHPVVLSTSDRSRDITALKAYPMLESLSFSGEEILTLPVTFKCYPETDNNERAQYFVYGDSSQTLT